MNNAQRELIEHELEGVLMDIQHHEDRVASLEEQLAKAKSRLRDSEQIRDNLREGIDL